MVRQHHDHPRESGVMFVGVRGACEQTAEEEDVEPLAEGLQTPSISSFFCSATKDSLRAENEEVPKFK